MKPIFYIVIILFLSATYTIQADETTPPDTTTYPDETTPPDTVLFHEKFILEDATPVTDSTDYEQQKYQNPTTALFKSMVMPGWGQYRNKKKLKAFLFASFDIWMIVKALDHKKKANDLWDKFDSYDDVTTRNFYHDLYDDERTLRNKYTWYAVITSFFAMFDAYVDAHLSGFPREKDKLSFDIVPSESNGAIVSLSLRF